MKNIHAVYATLIAGAVIIVVGAILVSAVRYNSEKSAELSPAPTNNLAPVSPSPVVEPVPEVSPTPATPTPSTTASPAATFPQSARTFLANFYAAYNQSDRDRLETYFTSDTTAELKSLHSRLFKGVDTEGNPGGPTLFSTSSASQRATGYSIITTAQKANDWIVTVQEQRVGAEGSSLKPITTLVTLTPSQSTWLIDAYTRSGETGKYSAFLSL